jgi:hypothetical protein
MHDMAFDINQNVAIVSIFDLEDVADQGIGCKGLAEVYLSLLEFYKFLILILTYS